MGDVCCDLAEFLLCLLKPSQCGCSPNMDYSTSLQEFTCTFQWQCLTCLNVVYFAEIAFAIYVVCVSKFRVAEH